MVQSDRIADAATVLPFRQRDFRSLVGARLRLTLVKRSSQYGSVYYRLGGAARDSDFAASSRAAEKRRRAKASLVQREVGRRPGGIVGPYLMESTAPKPPLCTGKWVRKARRDRVFLIFPFQLHLYATAGARFLLLLTARK